MALSYTFTREKAADILGVSTRTIDRYVKGGKLSYKKVANKVLLNQEEVMKLKGEYDQLHQSVNTEVVSSSQNSSISKSTSAELSNIGVRQFDQKLDKFVELFKEKDKLLEDKNKLIFMIQQRLGELETKLQQMIALPDYNEEKQHTLVQKQKLEDKIQTLRGNLKNEKLKNTVSLGLLFLVVFLIIAFFLYRNATGL